MEKYFDIYPIIKERVLTDSQNIYDAKDKEYPQEIIDKASDITSEPWRATAYAKEEMRKIYYRLQIIFGTFETEKNQIRERRNEKALEDAKKNRKVPHSVHRLSDKYIDEYPGWVITAENNLSLLINLFVFTMCLYTADDTIDQNLKECLNNVDMFFSVLAEKLKAINSKKSYNKTKKIIWAAFKKYNKIDISCLFKEFYVETNEDDVNDDNKKPKDKLFLSGLNLIPFEGSMFDNYNSLGTSDDFFERLQREIFPLLSSCTFDIKEFKETTLYTDFTYVYTFYHNIVVNLTPNLGEINDIELNFFNFLTTEFIDKSETQSTQTMYNKIKKGDWSTVPNELKLKTIEFIDQITYCDVIKDDESSEDEEPIYDFSRINKYVQATSHEELFEKLQELKFKIMFPYKYFILEEIKNVTEMIFDAEIDHFKFHGIMTKIDLLKSNIDDSLKNTGNADDKKKEKEKKKKENAEKEADVEEAYLNQLEEAMEEKKKQEELKN